MQEPVQRGIHRVERKAGAHGDPPRVSAERRRPCQSQNSFSLLLHTRVIDDARADAQSLSETLNHLWRQAAPAAKDLRKRGMIGAEITRERPERVARIALAALPKLGPERLLEIHGATVWRTPEGVNGSRRESGANPLALCQRNGRATRRTDSRERDRRRSWANGKSFGASSMPRIGDRRSGPLSVPRFFWACSRSMKPDERIPGDSDRTEMEFLSLSDLNLRGTSWAAATACLSRMGALKRSFGVPPSGSPGRVNAELQTAGSWRAFLLQQPRVESLN